jgi:hypothetical protein
VHLALMQRGRVRGGDREPEHEEGGKGAPHHG